MKHIKSSIYVKLGKFDKELKKLTSNINYLRNNDRTFTEWCKVTNSRLESISNPCDRIERKNQVHNDELETHIDENSFLEIVDNTSIFATHLEISESERKKLKNEIIAHVETSHKNYELNSHIPRDSTPFTEIKPFVKESLTPFLGENAISEKDIPTLEEWPTFSGEGEYNHIELIRTIDMLQEYFHIPN
ncbi:hypothetical protein O181_086060 [Austropuccinia psidii MF-1]|uniref:Uncharacterized protein n=1 Tax=Austropuccinia psidii MF-1 TaxID=1389203 RepID=A0A9Q3FTH0_9BASI|nr:hypothetical protein [Austropuccinia psidii MF-1]